MTRSRGIEVQIDELILHGFNAADRHRIGDAFRIELAKLLGTEQIARSIAQSASIERLDGGSITLQGPDARSLGQAIGRSVMGGLSQWAG